MALIQFVPALAGGLVLGLSAATLLLFEGRIAGISGIVGRLFAPRDGEVAWRVYFVAGLLVGAVVLRIVAPNALGTIPTASMPVLGASGLLVGFGTRLANGCTSGHGVCGLSRRSARSAAAVATFMGVAMMVVFVVRHVVSHGGAA